MRIDILRSCSPGIRGHVGVRNNNVFVSIGMISWIDICPYPPKSKVIVYSTKKTKNLLIK